MLLRVIASRTHRALETCGAYKSFATSAVRASSSSSTTSLPPRGVNPLYDAALERLAAARDKKHKEAEAIKKAAEDSGTYSRYTKKRLEMLEVAADKNDPEILFTYQNEQVDLSRPIYRYLRLADFKAKDIPKLMERSMNMHVLPDILPLETIPKAHVALRFPDQMENLVPGDLVSAKTSMEKPSIEVLDFSGGKRYYTMMLVDLDHPNPVDQTYSTRCHWLQANVCLSLKDPQVTQGDECVSYLPPHPARGTKAHRYVLLVLGQKGEIPKESLTKLPNRGLDVKRWLKKYDLYPRGWSFFRVTWEPEVVDAIHRDYLGVTAPVFGQWQNAKSLGIDLKEASALHKQFEDLKTMAKKA